MTETTIQQSLIDLLEALEGLLLPWMEEDAVRRMDTLSYPTKLTLLVVDTLHIRDKIGSKLSRNRPTKHFEDRPRQACPFLMGKIMKLKNGKESKSDRVRIGNNLSHEIRNATVDLTKEEFSRKAKKYVSLLYDVYCKWAGAAENSDSHGGANWQTMKEWKRDEVMKEFFELYLTG